MTEQTDPAAQLSEIVGRLERRRSDLVRRRDDLSEAAAEIQARIDRLNRITARLKSNPELADFLDELAGELREL